MIISITIAVEYRPSRSGQIHPLQRTARKRVARVCVRVSDHRNMVTVLPIESIHPLVAFPTAVSRR